MKLFDRMLCVSAGGLGVAIFVVAVQKADMLPWALPVGIIALLAGLTTASVVAWRGRWQGHSPPACATLFAAAEREVAA